MTLDAREKKIASELQHAAKVEEEAKKSMAEWKQKNDEFEKKRTATMLQAAKEADDKKVELISEAHKEYENLRARLAESLHNEQINLQQEFTERISSEAFSIAGKVLEELADVTLEDRIVKVFCERLRKIEEADIKEMTGIFRQSNHLPIIRSVFTMTQENSEKVKKTVMDVFRLDTDIVFETDADLISGLELSMNGHSIKWNIKTYLDELKVATEVAFEKDKKVSEHGDETRDAQNHP
ncbi:MAG: hypothetical protein NT163_12220 [Chlorobiales bacterium]|nr:hypothetical protein [Chlorobiales bacterium]